MNIFDDEKVVYSYRKNRVVTGTAKFPNGREFEWTTLDLMNSVTILTYNVDTKKFVFLEQWRPAINAFVIEQVAGGLESHLTAIENAIKEVHEEVGYKLDSRNIKCLGQFYSIPGLMNFSTYYFYAECSNDQFVGQKLEETELIKTFEASRGEFNQLIKDGRIVDPEIMTAFYLYDLLGCVK